MSRSQTENYDQKNVKLMVDQRDYGEDDQGDGSEKQKAQVVIKKDNKPTKELKPDAAMIDAKKPNREQDLLT